MLKRLPCDHIMCTECLEIQFGESNFGCCQDGNIIFKGLTSMHKKDLDVVIEKKGNGGVTGNRKVRSGLRIKTNSKTLILNRRRNSSDKREIKRGSGGRSTKTTP